MIPQRPSRRKMPPLKKLLQHLGMENEAYCQKCLVPVRSELLIRAHLIDRARDGLDGVQNLAALCEWCHDRMPSFGNGDEDAVIAWLRAPWEGEYHNLMRIAASREGILVSDLMAQHGYATFHEMVVAEYRRYKKARSYFEDAA